MAVSWIVAPFSAVDVFERFRGLLCLHNKGGRRPETLLLHLIISFFRKSLVTYRSTAHVTHTHTQRQNYQLQIYINKREVNGAYK